MKKFLDEDFLLETKTAARLYHTYVADLPIIDYHNHLPPRAILENSRFSNLTQAWLYGDHYKWRAMRSHGIAEKYCTGGASDEAKFLKWAETVPYTMRNPLYHWSHLELQRYFGIEELLKPETAKAIYKDCNEQLQKPSHSIQGLLNQRKVEVVCTTDDPLDSLEHHTDFAKAGKKLKMLPAFRPDRFFSITRSDYPELIQQLGTLVGFSISTFDQLKEALAIRVDYFTERGCSVCDHGLENINFISATEKELEGIFTKAIRADSISAIDLAKFQTGVLLFLGKKYEEKGWVQQFHLGAMRNNNLRAMKSLGPDTGWDSIGDYSQAQGVSQLLGHLDLNNQLTKTIIYNLNPADNEVLATMIGNFNDGTVAGKVQWGSGWWFLDQKDGMEKQLNTLSQMGLISHFVGMLTDSRSFLSFPRHEYFRRILCNLFGNDMEKGELPNDEKWIGEILQNICYYNAKNYFKF